MASSDIDNRIASLSKDIEALSKDVAGDESSRKALLGAMMQGLGKVELPVETIWRMIMSVCDVYLRFRCFDEIVLVLNGFVATCACGPHDPHPHGRRV